MLEVVRAAPWIKNYGERSGIRRITKLADVASVCDGLHLPGYRTGFGLLISRVGIEPCFCRTGRASVRACRCFGWRPSADGETQPGRHEAHGGQEGRAAA